MSSDSEAKGQTQQGSVSVAQQANVHLAQEQDVLGIPEHEFDSACEELNEIGDIAVSTWASNLGWVALGTAIALGGSMIPVGILEDDASKALLVMALLAGFSALISFLCLCTHLSLASSRRGRITRLHTTLVRVKERARKLQRESQQ